RAGFREPRRDAGRSLSSPPLLASHMETLICAGVFILYGLSFSFACYALLEQAGRYWGVSGFFENLFSLAFAAVAGGVALFFWGSLAYLPFS
ncbi:hypothetical protein, partial [Alienimonas sp. DA493]|uniref:hypothetical protein n=1 Tax=Alienimonas sp. DA493 TaxID=3373605 RepID=UPI0037541F47